MGIEEIKELEAKKEININDIDGTIICFYCQEEIKEKGYSGKGSWMFHKDCFEKHKENIPKY